MKKIITTIIVLALLAVGAYIYITRAPSAPSTDINSAGQSNNLTATSSQKLYRIASAQSLARFDIDEVLNNKPFTATGTTTQIAGDIIVKSTTDIEIGTVKINARTFKTDSEKRDGAIARAILKSESSENEFITFKPTNIAWTSGSLTVGELAVLKITGDLTISGVTKPATFDVILEDQGDKLSGAGHTTIKRSDFNLVIPNLSFLAGVDDEFRISTTIVAMPVTQ